MDLVKLKSELSECYKYKIELHAHSFPASDCSEVSVDELIKTYSALGFDGLVLTNHFYYRRKFSKQETVDKFLKDYYTAENEAQKCGIKVYLGAEIRFTENDNDYLIYGVDEKIISEIYDYLKLGVENFRQNYEMPKSIFIQAHPMREWIVPVKPEILDGIEVFNVHPNHNSRIGLASLQAKENGISVITAGSDFHHAEKSHEGLSAMLTNTLPKDTFHIAEILKARDYLLSIGNSVIFP